MKRIVQELFVLAKDVIPRGYSKEEVASNLLAELIFLGVFGGDGDDFVWHPGDVDLLFEVYQKTLQGREPTLEDLAFLDNYEVPVHGFWFFRDRGRGVMDE